MGAEGRPASVLTPGKRIVDVRDSSTAPGGPATVVISQLVKRGRDEAVWHWQEDVNQAVSGFTGYLGNDIATSGDGDEWTVIYRFDSKPHLLAWLNSQERDDVLSQGAGLFDGPASQQVLIRAHDAEQVTVVVSHPVGPDDEEEFLAWQQRVTDAERTFPGFQGAELFRPVPGVQPAWTALYRYDSDEHADAWLESDVRRRLLGEGRRFQDFELRRISSPFGSWFAQPGEDEAGASPANWKTALSVLIGLYPTVVLLTLAISEIWSSASLWQSLLLGNILSVSLLTWVVMPVVTRALRFWLVPGRGGFTVRTDIVGAAVSIAFLTCAALIFWLCTTQIWHLP
jgi:antibiotic biosynthesis monooxygenase (ABM) superfamily enzyme